MFRAKSGLIRQKVKRWMGNTQHDYLATLNFKLCYILLTSCSPTAAAVESVNGGESGAVSIYRLNISNLTKLKRTSLDKANTSQLILYLDFRRYVLANCDCCSDNSITMGEKAS